MAILFIVTAIGILLMPVRPLIMFSCAALVTGVFRGFFYSYTGPQSVVFIILLVVCIGLFIYGVVTGIKSIINKRGL